MKVVHNNVNNQSFHLTFSECLKKAHELETNNDTTGAAKLYKKCIKLNPTHESAYNRLMLLYRKKKDYQKEFAVINKGIAAFEKLYTGKLKGSTIITKLSNALLKSTGLADKKGKILFELQPILRWRKRAVLVKKRL